MNGQELDNILNRLTKEAEEGEFDVSMLERIQPLLDQYMLVRLKQQQLIAKGMDIPGKMNALDEIRQGIILNISHFLQDYKNN
jgi:hypothetical protein